MNTSQPEVNLPTSTGDPTTVTALSTSLNPFNVAPNLNEATILQGPEPEAPKPLNPTILTPPPTVKHRHPCLQRQREKDDGFIL